jgi:hypothetical protein
MPSQVPDRAAVDLQHHINPTQLDQILSEVSRKEQRRFDLHDAAQIVQVAALVAGGIWALFEFRTFKSENSRLTLEQQRFAVQQQEIAREQQKLSIDMATVSLAYQKKQDELSGLALSKSKQTRFEFNSHLTAKPVSQSRKNGVFSVDVEFKVTNTSDTDFVVTASVIEIFIAEPVPMLRSNLDVITISFPPAITDTFYNPKPAAGLEWKKIAGKAHVFQEEPLGPSLLLGNYPNPIIGGGGTLRLKAGESTTGSMTLLVKANPDAWVGAVVNLGFGDGHYDFLKETAPLSDKPPTKLKP